MHTDHLLLPRTNLWLMVLLLTFLLNLWFRTEPGLLDKVYGFLEIWGLSLFVLRRIHVMIIVYWLSIVKDMLLSLSNLKLDRCYLVDGAS